MRWSNMCGIILRQMTGKDSMKRPMQITGRDLHGTFSCVF